MTDWDRDALATTLQTGKGRKDYIIELEEKMKENKENFETLDGKNSADEYFEKWMQLM